jgi:hypothetical protein
MAVNLCQIQQCGKVRQDDFQEAVERGLPMLNPTPQAFGELFPDLKHV